MNVRSSTKKSESLDAITSIYNTMMPIMASRFNVQQLKAKGHARQAMTVT